VSINTVEELPPVAGGYSPGVWLERLNDAFEDVDSTHWHLVFEAETADKAGSAVSNLKRRKVSVPDPEGRWQFAQRGVGVWARYNGPYARRGRSKKPSE
jgi:hypothetical protein